MFSILLAISVYDDGKSTPLFGPYNVDKVPGAIGSGVNSNNNNNNSNNNNNGIGSGLIPGTNKPPRPHNSIGAGISYDKPRPNNGWSEIGNSVHIDGKILSTTSTRKPRSKPARNGNSWKSA
jgi:hypothetical protein